MKIVVRGDELLFKPLFLKANTTLSAAVILFLFPFTMFSDPHLMGGLLPYIHLFRSSPPYTCSSSKPILEYMSYQASSLTLCER